MIEVEVGDTIVEFPDGTHPDIMRSALQKQFPPQQRETPVGKPLSPTQQMLGGAENLLPAAEQRTNPNAEAYSRYLGPATIGEADEVFYKDAQGRPVPTDSSKHVVIRDPRDGQVKVFERSPDTEEGGLVGASRVLAPGLATGSLARTPGAARAIKPAEQSARATQNEIIEASKRLSDELGAPVEIPRAISSDSLLTQQAGAQLRNVPVLGTPLVKNTEKAIEQLGAATGKVAENLGGATVEGAGTAAKESLLDWIGPQSKGLVSKAYDELDAVMDPAAVHRLDSTAALAAEMRARNIASGQPEGSRALNLVERAIKKPEVEDSQLIKDLSAVMGREGALKAAARMGEDVTATVAAPEGLTFQGTKDLRTRVGQLMDQKILPPEWSGAELKRLYGSLSEDLDRIVGTSGNTSAKALWQKANDTAREVAQHRKQLSDIVGIKGDATVAEVVDRITKAAGGNTRADIDLLIRAKGIIGDDWDKVVSATTAKLGINSQGQWAPGTFLKDWQKLSPAGKSALYGTGAHKQALEDIARISTRWPQLQKFQNPSGTAQNVMGGAVGMGVVLHPLATLAKLLDPMTAAGIGGATLMARALAKPATAASTASWVKSYERLARSRSPASLSHFGIQTRNLINTFNSQLGTNLSPEDLKGRRQ